MKLFSAAWCGNCGSVKQLLKNKGVEFTEIDVDSDEGMEMAAEYRIRSLPSLLNGDTLIVGAKNIMEFVGEMNV